MGAFDAERFAACAFESARDRVKALFPNLLALHPVASKIATLQGEVEAVVGHLEISRDRKLCQQHYADLCVFAPKRLREIVEEARRQLEREVRERTRVAGSFDLEVILTDLEVRLRDGVFATEIAAKAFMPGG